MRSKRLWRRYVNNITQFLDIIHRPDFLFKNDVSETELYLRPQVKLYSVGPNRQS
jgi:hypothetical protein